MPGKNFDVINTTMLNQSSSKEMAEKALAWIVEVLNNKQISYSICGGLAANFYGSKRPLNDIDLFVAEHDFYTVVEAGKDYISKPAQHYCEASEGWDLDYVQFIYDGVKIEVGSAKNARIYDVLKSNWQELKVDFKNTVKGKFLGSEISVMPAADLISYKTQLGRPVDILDISAVKSMDNIF